MSESMNGWPVVELAYGKFVFTCTSEDDQVWMAIFEGVQSVLYWGFSVCEIDFIESADILHEIVDSDWARSTVGREIDAVLAPVGKIKHYRIYINELGCYELLASNVKISS